MLRRYVAAHTTWPFEAEMGPLWQWGLRSNGWAA